MGTHRANAARAASTAAACAAASSAWFVFTHNTHKHLVSVNTHLVFALTHGLVHVNTHLLRRHRGAGAARVVRRRAA
jgi:hypothetical protein